jgi:serine protease Do
VIPRARSPVVRALTIFAVAAILATPLAGCRRRVAKKSVPTPSSRPAVSPAPRTPVKVIYPSAPGSFVKLVERARRGVVHLRGERPARGGPADWFSATASSPATAVGSAQAATMQKALGTGFIVDRRGLILTNAHVLADHKQIVVRFFDDRETPAKLLGYDARIDVALLSVPPGKLGKAKPLRLGRSRGLRIGEWLLALGNPFGLQISATTGIVSSLPRRDLPLAARGLWGYLQSDLRIHPGNSGGPVLGMLGEVVGLATATREETPGIGFVLPVDVVRRVLPMLEKEGKVARAWIGIYIGKLDAKRAKLLGLKKPGGALVTGLVPQGPAARAGVRRGDVIISFAGKPITAASELPWLAAVTGVNKVVQIEVWRMGAKRQFSIKTEAMPQ